MAKRIEFIAHKGNTEFVASGLTLTLSRPLKSDAMITISEVKDITSENQRRTARMWSNEWAKHEGSTDAQNCYNWFKCAYLWPQIAKNNPELEEKLENIKIAFPGVMKSIIGVEMLAGILSNKDADTEEFHHALSNFQVWLISERGVPLTDPDKHHAIRKLAMETGKTQKVKK